MAVIANTGVCHIRPCADLPITDDPVADKFVSPTRSDVDAIEHQLASRPEGISSRQVRCSEPLKVEGFAAWDGYAVLCEIDKEAVGDCVLPVITPRAGHVCLKVLIQVKRITFDVHWSGLMERAS